MNDIKLKHTEIQRLENQQKMLQVAIKQEKAKNSDKDSKDRKLKQNENASFRLETEIKDLEETKRESARLQKIQYHNLVEELNLTKREVGLLEIKLKEKDQETKLVEMKIKELKKQMPNTKLKPLRQRTNRTHLSTDRHSFDNKLVQEHAAIAKIRKPSVPRQAKSIRSRKYTQDA